MLPHLRRAKFSKGVLYSIIWVRFEGSKYTKRRSGLAGQESHNLLDRQQNSAPDIADRGEFFVKKDVNAPATRNHGRTMLQAAAAGGHLVGAFHCETEHTQSQII
jgi:hypothetical protein